MIKEIRTRNHIKSWQKWQRGQWHIFQLVPILTLAQNNNRTYWSDCYILDQCTRMTISSPKPHTGFIFSALWFLLTWVQVPNGLLISRVADFRIQRERKCVNFVKYSTSSSLQTSQRLQPIQLTSSHLIQHAVSCEEMCLSINSLYWLQEVKLFP